MLSTLPPPVPVASTGNLFSVLTKEPFHCTRLDLTVEDLLELRLRGLHPRDHGNGEQAPLDTMNTTTLFFGQLPMGTTPETIEKLLYAIARERGVPLKLDSVTLNPQNCTCAFARMGNSAALFFLSQNKQFVLNEQTVWLAPSPAHGARLADFVANLPRNPLKPRAKKPIVVEIVPDKHLHNSATTSIVARTFPVGSAPAPTLSFRPPSYAAAITPAPLQHHSATVIHQPQTATFAPRLPTFVSPQYPPNGDPILGLQQPVRYLSANVFPPHSFVSHHSLNLSQSLSMSGAPVPLRAASGPSSNTTMYVVVNPQHQSAMGSAGPVVFPSYVVLQ